jgi:hypothetical protein
VIRPVVARLVCEAQRSATEPSCDGLQEFHLISTAAKHNRFHTQGNLFIEILSINGMLNLDELLRHRDDVGFC